MKGTLFSLLFLSGVTVLLGAENPRQESKTSDMPIEVESEVAAYYQRLIESDEEIRKRVQALTAEVQKWNGPHYRSSKPRVVEWFPSEQNWNVGVGTSSYKARFLVVQPLGSAKSKHSEIQLALVAEFEVNYETTSAKPDEQHPERSPEFLSGKLNIKFLGFRDPNLQKAKLK